MRDIQSESTTATKEEEAKFFASFILTLDSKTHATLCAVADKNERSAPRLLRRLIKLIFVIVLLMKLRGAGGMIVGLFIALMI
jgi:hypothetical protein